VCKDEMGRAVNGTAFFLISKMLFFAIKAYRARVRLEEEACFRHQSPAKSMRERTRAPEREVKGGEGTCSRHRISLFPDYHQWKEKRRVAIELYQSERLILFLA
jgi:hypothetical protein